MTYYFVVARDSNGEVSTILCNGRKELATLLTHIDDSFQVVTVNALDNVNLDIKPFCKKSSLEHGEVS